MLKTAQKTPHIEPERRMRQRGTCVSLKTNSERKRSEEMDANKCINELAGKSSCDTRRTKRIDRVCRRITQFIAGLSKPVTGRQIAESVNSRTQDVYEALDLLRSCGRIGSSGDGVKGDPVLYSIARLKVVAIEPSIPLVSTNVGSAAHEISDSFECEEFVV